MDLWIQEHLVHPELLSVLKVHEGLLVLGVLLLLLGQMLQMLLLVQQVHGNLVNRKSFNAKTLCRWLKINC